MTTRRRSVLPLGLCLLSACTLPPQVQLSPDEAPMVMGSRVRQNTTINTAAFECFDALLAARKKPKMDIAIGNIADYTGKTADGEGSVITKGGSLMLFSALGLMPQTVRLHDRFDTSVTDLEMTYINARQLGDGAEHQVDGKDVPWMPYYGGSIQKSDYVILGGITEVNFNISSGGYSAQVNQIGPKSRTFTMSVAADLRIVETDSLVVVAASSFQKQFTGYEVGANVFSFFDVFNDTQLFDVYAGNIAQEPMQLGVRAILEEATLELLSEVTEVDYHSCVPPAPGTAKAAEVAPAESARPAAKPAAAAVDPADPLMSKQPAAPTPAAPAPAAPAPAAPAPAPAAEPAAPKADPKAAPTKADPAKPAAPAPAAPKDAPKEPAKAAAPKAAAPKEAAPKDAAPKATGSKTGTVIVGAFSTEANAKAAAAQISGIGLTARIEQSDTSKGKLWLVRVFTTRAPSILARIHELGFPDAYYLAE